MWIIKILAIVAWNYYTMWSFIHIWHNLLCNHLSDKILCTIMNLFYIQDLYSGIYRHGLSCFFDVPVMVPWEGRTNNPHILTRTMGINWQPYMHYIRNSNIFRQCRILTLNFVTKAGINPVECRWFWQTTMIEALQIFVSEPPVSFVLCSLGSSSLPILGHHNYPLIRQHKYIKVIWSHFTIFIIKCSFCLVYYPILGIKYSPTIPFILQKV